MDRLKRRPVDFYWGSISEPEETPQPIIPEDDLMKLTTEGDDVSVSPSSCFCFFKCFFFF